MKNTGERIEKYASLSEGIISKLFPVWQFGAMGLILKSIIHYNEPVQKFI
jgi:hypothetical protein